MPNRINPLAKVQSLVADDDFLRSSIMELQLYDNALVVFITRELPASFVDAIISPHWDGPVEVYCASDIMIGTDKTN